MSHDRIHVDVPAGDQRRVEREVFSQLAAMRSVDRANAVAPRRRTPWFVVAVPAACAAALAIVVVLFLVRDRDANTATSAVANDPSLVVTPVEGSSRFTVGDAIIDAGGDTSVEVRNGEDGVTLVLQRGTVDCDVAPRAGRPPFRVIGGDVHVEVVGTRFTVTRIGAGARVDVARGRVRVRAPSGERMLTPGETWTPATGTMAITADAPTAVAPITATGPGSGADPSSIDPARVDPPTAPTAPPRPTRRVAFAAAQRLEATDAASAAKAYRALANGRDAWAALALYSLAELHAATPAVALRELDEFARRFPQGANAEDAAWLRVDVLRRSRRVDEARRAAAAYLSRFPNGTYATAAAALGAR